MPDGYGVRLNKVTKLTGFKSSENEFISLVESMYDHHKLTLSTDGKVKTAELITPDKYEQLLKEAGVSDEISAEDGMRLNYSRFGKVSRQNQGR